jgi:anti-sigma-K factor RskA
MNRETLLELIPAYTLGALTETERAEVEAFIAADAEAQQLLAEYQSIADTLALAASAITAPPQLGEQLRQRLAAESPTAKPKSSSRAWTIRLLATAALIAVVTGVIAIASQQLPPASGAALYDRLVNEAGSQQIVLNPGDNQAISGELVFDADGSEAVMRVHQLPELTVEQSFQLWLVDSDGPQNGGLFRFDDAAGPNYIILPLEKSIDQYRAFGVSLEPRDGSPLPVGPSGPRVFNVTLDG